MLIFFCRLAVFLSLVGFFSSSFSFSFPLASGEGRGLGLDYIIDWKTLHTLNVNVNVNISCIRALFFSRSRIYKADSSSPPRFTWEVEDWGI